MNGQGYGRHKLLMLLALGVGVLGLAGICKQSLAHDDRGDDSSRFSDRSIKGYWGYNTSFGMVMPPAVPQPQPTAAMGRMYFDGRGGCDVKAVANIAGESISLQSSVCSYQVNADGTGTAQAVFPGAPIADPVPVAFVIVDGGREMRLVNTRHIVETFTARRQ